MKKFFTVPILAALIAAGTALNAQDYPEEYLGLPGDNLNLYAVMKLFQESRTLEEFERNLNDEKNKINNLDLNGDNLIDYIMVFDNVDGNVHNIVLRVAISQRESQDVAVFTVQKLSDGQVYIQLAGDEDLYGKNYIIEPIYDENSIGETPNPGYTGNTAVVYGRKVTIIRTTPVYIASWPMIHYIYDPGYVIWRSRWYWGFYPDWWNPWRPYYWHYYYGYHYHWYDDYYCYYRRWHVHRYTHWNDYYYNRIRIYSPIVRVNIHSDRYRQTYSRPDQRRAGEELYTQTVPEQSRRRPVTGSANGNVNRQGNGPERRSEVTTSTRRASEGVDNNVNRAERSATTTVNNRRPAGTVSNAGGNSEQRSVQAGNATRRTESEVSRPQSQPARSSVSRPVSSSSGSQVSRSQGQSSGSSVSRPVSSGSGSQVSRSQGQPSRSSVSRPASSSSRSSVSSSRPSAPSRSSSVSSGSSRSSSGGGKQASSSSSSKKSDSSSSSRRK